MTTPSKLGPIVLGVFGLPFLGMGLFAAYTFLNTANQPLTSRIGGAIFASVFAIIGGGLIFGSLYGYLLQKEQARRELANPASPWLWRQDWAAGRVESKNKSRATGWWVGAVLANMLVLPLSLACISQWLATRNPAYIVPAAFGLIGILVLFGAIRATIRLKRFGRTYFEMASLPFSPGRHLSGSIHLHLDTNVPHGIDLKLWCARRVVSGSGEDRSTHLLPLWEESKNIPPSFFAHGPLDTVIPVEFTLPADALQTDRNNRDDQVLWLLKVNAQVPGVPYSDEFELPVFRTAQSAKDAAPAPTEPVDLACANTEVAEPENQRVVVTETPQGLEFYFRAARNLFRAVLVVALAAGCWALLYAMLRMPQRPPIFALAIVGLLTFFLTLAFLDAALTSTRIVVGSAMISWRHSVFGIGRTRRLPISGVASILPVTSMGQASSSGSTLYSLRLQTTAGRNYTLVGDIQNRQEARWIVFQIEKRAGFQLNTQIQTTA